MAWYKIVKESLYDSTIVIPDDSDGLLVTENVTLKNVTLKGGQTQLVLRSPCTIENLTLDGFGSDGLLICSSNITIKGIKGLYPRNLVPYNVRHPDFIQFIALNERNQPDYNGKLSNIIITDIELYAPEIPERGLRGVQGIVGLDSIVENLVIERFSILTDFNQHGISFTQCINSTIVDGVINSINGRYKPGVIFNNRKNSACQGRNIILKNIKTPFTELVNVTQYNVTNVNQINNNSFEKETGDNPMYDNTNAVVTTGKVKDHMQIAYIEAAKELHEVPGKGSNEEILKYWNACNWQATDDDVAWCAAFVNWVLMQANIPRTKSPSAMSFKDWGTEVKPTIGCVVVIPRGGWKGHVGFLANEDSKYYYVLGGNQNNSVNISKFEKSSHQFYFRWHKQLKNSKTAWLEIFKSMTGLSVGGAGVNEIANRTKSVTVPTEPDTGHGATTTKTEVQTGQVTTNIDNSVTHNANTATTETTTAVTMTAYTPPEGYTLVPDIAIWGVIIGAILYTLASLYIIKERNDKIVNQGI